MPELAKAQLRAMSLTDPPSEAPGSSDIPVQFNPSSLHLVLQSVTDQSKTPARPVEQHLGSGNLTVSLDLHFDSSDEGDTDAPSNVRDKTQQVAQFMLPQTGSSDPPPRIRFQWGAFMVVGVMGSYNEDIDLFSPQGVPLRAKVSISIRGQNPDYTANRTGAGAATGAGASAPGSTGGAPGTVGFGAGLSAGASVGFGASLGLSASLSAGIGIGGGLSLSATASDRTGVAIGGESAAEFTARMGADPSAWRGIAAGLDSTISIPAGTEIDFSSRMSGNVGVGTAIGVNSAASVPTAAAVGLAGESATPARPGAAPGTASGLALASIGGVQAAIQTVQITNTASAATSAKQAYALAPATPAAAPAPAPPAADQPRPPLRTGDLPVAAAQTTAPSAPPPPQADPRATTFGYGVPLRPLVTGAAGDRAGALGGVVLISARAAVPVTQAPTTVDPTAAPWLKLPPADPGRNAADAAQQKLRPLSACNCGGSCGCGCGGGCK